MTKTGYIYAISIKGTYLYRYVGYTVDIEKRKRQHFKNAKARMKTPVYLWMAKYSPQTIEFTVLEEPPYANLFFREQFWIAALREAGHRLLNLTDGGGGTLGITMPESARLAIGIASSYPRSEETRKRMSESRIENKDKWYKPTLSDEHRRKISESVTGDKNPFYGKKHSDSTKEEASKRQSKWIAENGNPMLGRNHTAESRKKMSETKRLKGISDKVLEANKTNVWNAIHARNHKSFFNPECPKCLENR